MLAASMQNILPFPNKGLSNVIQAIKFLLNVWEKEVKVLC